MHYLTELNDKQMEAVKNKEGYVRVIAGAGSGKTKLLVSRYVYLVKEYGVDPKNILCVTFTNKAAAEMKKRIRALIGDEHDTTLICTYHGFCARLLRENPEKLYMTKNFQIIDTTQQRSILGEIYQKYELKLDNASFGSILKKIGEYKSTHMYVPLICSPENIQIVDDISTMDALIIEDYMQRQKAIAAYEGKEVTHHIFGKGKIISTDSVSCSYRIQFDFLPNPRNIMMSYFNKAKETLSKEDDVKTVPGMKNLQYTVVPDEDIKPVEENTYRDVQKEVPDINAGFEAEEVFDIPGLKELSADPPSPEELEEQAKAEAVKKQLEDCDNLWKRDDVPKTGWICEGVTDLGGPYGVCQMCGYQIIRYVHHMVHPEYGRVDAGCVCAGKMEGNIEAAKEREQEVKNKASRRENFKKRKWKTSRNGNSYIKAKDHIVVLYKRKTDNAWKYSIDNVFCIEVFETKEEAQMATFEALDAILKK